jgi:GNAT superfamily N-acetyltransferase
MMRVSGATEDDVFVLLPLIRAYWEFESISGFDSDQMARQLKRLLSAPYLGAGWIAWEDDIAVGYLLAVYVFSLEHKGLTAEIDELFVSPTARNLGVGAKLIGDAEVEFVRIGCTNVSLQLSRTNEAARRFYHRRGYEERASYELLEKTLDAA